MNRSRSFLLWVFAGMAVSSLAVGWIFQSLRPEWRGTNVPLHATLEAMGSTAALAMAVVLFHRRPERDEGHLFWLGAGFLGMGILEGFHAMAGPGESFIFLRCAASLVGAFGFAMACLRDSEKTPIRSAWAPWIVGVGALVFGTTVVAFPDQVPLMESQGAFTTLAVAINLLAGVCFLGAAGWLALRFQQSGTLDIYLFSGIALLFGLAEMMFATSALWDPAWWWWHFLRLGAYFLVLGYGVRTYVMMVGELRRSEDQLFQALDERERLSHDLHDDIIQSIYAVGLGLGECRRIIASAPEQVGRKLADAIADLNLVIRDVRGYITGRQPESYAGPGLESAITSLVRTMRDAGTMEWEVTVDPIAAGRVTTAEGAHLLHILQEAMSNSLRHAQARSGRVVLRLDEGAVRLELEDDGQGFETQAVEKPGHGLRNMAARARKLGATLQVSSGPGRGTRVVLMVPKERTHASA